MAGRTENPQIVTAPRELAQKFAPVTFKPEDIAAVEQVLERFREQNQSMIVDEVRRLAEAWHEASKEYGADLVKNCVAIAHDLGGYGGTLGFPMVTSLCRSLCRYLRLEREILPSACSVIEAHVSALQVVAAKQIKGDGGAVGRALSAELSHAIEKFEGDRARAAKARA
ncbi:MAG: Hpt domain-containing protein [Alphaproteobacteria bacterium]|nr:Hpt domain-containing protein [Alphaproteobacteria bacterium]